MQCAAFVTIGRAAPADRAVQRPQLDFVGVFSDRMSLQAAQDAAIVAAYILGSTLCRIHAAHILLRRDFALASGLRRASWVLPFRWKDAVRNVENGGELHARTLAKMAR
jgi:hypothetical protein